MTQETAKTDRAEESTADSRQGGPVAVPRQVHCELQTLRQLGVDPFGEDVLDTLDAYDFDAAREWAISHPDQYVRAVSEGTVDETLAGGPDGRD